MKAIVNFENRHVAILSHEVTNDDHATLAEHRFAGWEVHALFQNEPEPPSITTPTVSHIDQKDEQIGFGYQLIDPNKYTVGHTKHWHQPQDSINKEFIKRDL